MPEAWVPVAVVLVPVMVESLVVSAVAAVPVPVVVPVLVSVPVLVPVEALAPVEQTTELGTSVTPPRAQIDLATLRVAVQNCVSFRFHFGAIRTGYG